MKKEFEEAEVIVIRLEEEDVICTSCPNDTDWTNMNYPSNTVPGN